MGADEDEGAGSGAGALRVSIERAGGGERDGGYFGTSSSFKSGPVVALEASETARDPDVGARLWAVAEAQHGACGEWDQS